jgi:exopolysaccharide biosynthesis polyprenyl glycosylphosphotransferase
MTNANVSVETRLHEVPRIHPSPATFKRIYQLSLLVSDAAMLVLAFALAYWLRFEGGIGLRLEVIGQANDYIHLSFIVIPVWLGLFALLRLYDYEVLLGGTSEYTRVLNACTLGVMVVIVVEFLFESVIFSRAWLLQAWLLSCLSVCLARLMLRRGAYALRRRGYFISPTVIIGTNAEAMSLATQLRDSIYSGLGIVGFIYEHDGVERDQVPVSCAGLPVLGTLSHLGEVLERRHIEEAIVATTALTREQRLETALRLTEMPTVKMSMSSGLYEVMTTSVQVTTKNAVPLLSMNRMRLDPMEVALKTALDYAVILLAAPTLVLLFAIVSLLIRLDSPGPIFYRRRVLGVGGKEFDALKFRTMVVNGDEVLAQYPDKLAEWRENFKVADDPRITRVGRLLRSTSLDELPQLFNVLIGQMSLVGPRMIHPDEGAKYGIYRSNLLTVKPGLTGLWQVSGRSDLSYEERIHLDMHYIRNYSIWTDLHILFFQTVAAVLTGRGAR